MKIPVNEIRVRLGRRDAAPEAVQALAGSMAESGLMNPVTVDAGHNLICRQIYSKPIVKQHFYDIRRQLHGSGNTK